MSEKHTILIVEDNPLSLKLVKDILLFQNFHVLEATNGEDGIKAAKHYKPDLILVDILMPGKDGYEVATELKKGSETKTIPLIALTALAMLEEQEKALASGYSKVINKPFKVKEFIQTLESFF